MHPNLSELIEGFSPFEEIEDNNKKNAFKYSFISNFKFLMGQSRALIKKGKSQIFLGIIVALAISSYIADERNASAANPEQLTYRRVSDYAFDSDNIRGVKQSPLNSSIQSPRFPQIEKVSLQVTKSGILSKSLPSFTTQFAGRTAALNEKNEFVFYSIEPKLQEYVRTLVARARADHVAIVAMEPSSGRVLAMDGKSSTIPDILFHSKFPAASLFKVITAATAIEHGQIGEDSLITFRGGNYVLSRQNYSPDLRRDRRRMSVGEALGKSCNPVFGRLALRFMNAPLLKNYARRFGFNSDLRCDVKVPVSSAFIPSDPYELSLTGAGFGDVTISPIHAASIMSGVANEGKLLRPIFVDSVVAPTGVVIYKAKPQILQQIVHPRTSKTLLDMMENTTTVGTSKNEFLRRNQPLKGIQVAAKTGTLRGTDPLGLNHWFIAAAPKNRAKIAVAVIVNNQIGENAKASRLGRQVLEQYLGSH